MIAKTDTAGSASRTEQYGLIGHPLGHSLSPVIHRALLKILDIPGDYQLFDLNAGELQRKIPELMATLDGFNCTIPYKKQLVPYLSDLSPEARRYGSVNTVYKGVGYNTDAAGFMATGFHYAGSRVLILGTGGVSHTMAHCVALAGAREVVFQTGHPTEARAWLAELSSAYPAGSFHAYSPDQLAKAVQSNAEGFHFILNGTPAGMWPHAQGLPLARDLYRDLLGRHELSGVFDAIYNPVATRFILMAAAAGIRAVSGLHMLLFQAVEAQKIWHPERAADFDTAEVQARLTRLETELVSHLLEEYPVKLVLTGFMGSGKSSTGRLVADHLGKKVHYIDLDEAIVSRWCQSISEMFATVGEAEFRRRERAMLEEFLARSGSILLATGGGAMIQDGAEAIVREKGGQIILLDVSLETALARSNGHNTRPLLNQEYNAIVALYNQRRPLYLDMADLVINADLGKAERVDLILRNLQLA